jgi:hypothetical protein
LPVPFSHGYSRISQEETSHFTSENEWSVFGQQADTPNDSVKRIKLESNAQMEFPIYFVI